MEAEFEDPDLQRLEQDAAFNADYSRDIVRAFRKVMQLIRAAPDERDFYRLKSLHFEKLSGSRTGQHSMRLNIQFRLIVRIEGKHPAKRVIVVAIEDYH